jgi:HEAT repeat protein
LLGLAVGIWTTLYQARRGEALQQKLTAQNEQLQRDLARQNEESQRDLAHQNEQLQRDLVRTQKELERQYAMLERQEQREQEIDAADLKRQQMLRASTNEQRAQIYREALQADPRLSTIKILSMSRPLEILNVYVRLRLHQEPQLSYRHEELLREQELPLRDPNAAFQVDWQRREQRVVTALDPEEAVRTYPRCILLGDPGAGKTTLLRYLALMTAKRALPRLGDILPIYVELNAFVRSGLSDLLDYAAQTWDGLYAFPHDQARCHIANQLHEGKALFLLDALDETFVGETVENAERSYSVVSQAILQVAARYPHASLVVTARKAGYQQRASLAGFTELEVLDFRPEDIRQFILNWYTCSHDLHKERKVADLTLRLEKNPRLQVLATNPLLLSLIVLVYEAQLDLPDRRADLYKRCVDTLLMEWDAKRGIRRSRQFQPEHKRQLLAVIAWHFHQQGQRYFPEQELLTVIADFLPMVGLARDNSRSILLEIADEHGLLKEQAKGWYGFVHLTLQEYFVALAITDQDHLERLLIHRANTWWEEVFLLYAGSAPDMSLLLRQLLGQDQDHPLREDVFSTNLLLAGRCLSSRPTIRDASLRGLITTRLFATLQATPYALLQLQIAEVLAATGDPQNSKDLVRLLSDASLGSGLREHIAYVLGKLGERTVASELVRLLSDASLSDDLRNRIALALGEMGERSVASELVRLLSDASLDESLRGKIAFALGNLGERTVASELVRLLSDASLPKDLRERIASALGKLGECSITSELVRLLSDTSLDMWIRRSVAETLGELGERSVASELVRLLSDTSLDWSVQWSIAEVLGKLGERSVVSELVRLLSDASLNEYLQGSIAETLGELGERSVVSELVRLLSDASLSFDLRERIAEALGKLGERSVVSELVRLLSDASLDEYLRVEIASALGKLGERTIAASELVRLLSDASLNEYLRVEIASALGKLGERTIAASELVRLLSDASLNWDIRGSIAETLGELGERSVASELVRLLSDASLDWFVQGRIAETLGKLGERSVASELVRLLSDASLDTSLRWRIAEALGELGECSVASELVRLLSDASLSDNLRRSIAEALEKLGEHSVASELVRLLSDASLPEFLRRSIAEALKKLATDPVSIHQLACLLTHPILTDTAYDILWAVSRQAGVSIFPLQEPSDEVVEIVPWNDMAQ